MLCLDEPLVKPFGRLRRGLGRGLRTELLGMLALDTLRALRRAQDVARARCNAAATLSLRCRYAYASALHLRVLPLSL